MPSVAKFQANLRPSTSVVFTIWLIFEGHLVKNCSDKHQHSRKNNIYHLNFFNNLVAEKSLRSFWNCWFNVIICYLHRFYRPNPQGCASQQQLRKWIAAAVLSTLHEIDMTDAQENTAKDIKRFPQRLQKLSESLRARVTSSGMNQKNWWT